MLCRRLWQGVSIYTPLLSRGVDKSHSIARKCNFQKHLIWHKIYRPGMELEDHWKRRDPSRPKRVGYVRKPNKRSAIIKTRSLPVRVSCDRSTEEPELYQIGTFAFLFARTEIYDRRPADSTSRTYQTPCTDTLSLPPQTFEDHEQGHNQQDWPLWVDWKDFDSQDVLSYSSSSESSPTPPSMSYSSASSPGSSYLPLGDIYPVYAGHYSQPQPFSSQYQLRSNALPWFETPAAIASEYSLSTTRPEFFGATVPISHTLRA